MEGFSWIGCKARFQRDYMTAKVMGTDPWFQKCPLNGRNKFRWFGVPGM